MWLVREDSQAGLFCFRGVSLIEGVTAQDDYFTKGILDLNRFTAKRGGGFTLISLTITAAVISVMLAGASSWYSNHTIRTKIGKALAAIESAKMAILVTCAEDPSISTLTNSLTGYSFPDSFYVKSVSVSGSCASPSITVLTVNTGLLIEPTLTITGDKTIANGQRSWTCVSDGLDVHVPDTCHI
jgi:Tfp pilus assembly protein PilE